MAAKNPRVDAYIAQSAPFARPILRHLRATVHAACPAVAEDIKWGMPFFLYRGRILCHMAAFSNHAAFGFMRSRAILGASAKGGASGSFGRLTGVGDLPPTRVLIAYVKKAMALAEDKLDAPRPKRVARPLPKAPPAFGRVLKSDATLRRQWEAFTPGRRREYLEWILGAKQVATRERRIAQTIAQVREGKSQNWKYETKRSR